MSWPDLMGKLNAAIGLDPDTLGASTVQAHLRLRMASLGLDSPASYLDRLASDPHELDCLIDEIVVGETWFFRDDRPFACLAEYLLTQTWQKQQPGRVFRLLSAPCATGEEPYSMAMTLLDAGLPSDRFTIDAVDISHRFLQHARQGCYTANAFRGRHANWQDRYFTQVDTGFQVSPRVARCVNWQQANLTGSTFWQQCGVYDVIFCRNLLIYLDAAARQRLLGWIHDALALQGLLFAGHAEAMDTLDARFAPLRQVGSFAYGKRQGGDAPPAANGQPTTPTRRVSIRRASRLKSRPAPDHAATRLEHISTDVPAGDPLGTAAALADQGQLTQAIAVCQQYLEEHGPNARAYAILGVAHLAADDLPAAEAALTKAIYLDPANVDSLVQLAVLCDRTGRTDRAIILRQRASRHATRQETPE